VHPKNENVARSIPIAAVIVPLSITYLAPVDPALLIAECGITLIVVYLHEQKYIFHLHCGSQHSYVYNACYSLVRC